MVRDILKVELEMILDSYYTGALPCNYHYFMGQEGFDRSSRADFHRFIVIAKASGAEVQSQLYLALDIGYLGQKEFDVLMEKAKEVTRILGGLRLSLQAEKEK